MLTLAELEAYNAHAVAENAGQRLAMARARSGARKRRQ